MTLKKDIKKASDAVKRWREKNPEKLKAQRERYSKKNRDKISNYNNKYYLKKTKAKRIQKRIDKKIETLENEIKLLTSTHERKEKVKTLKNTIQNLSNKIK